MSDPLDVEGTVRAVKSAAGKVRDALEIVSLPLNDEQLNLLLDVQDVLLPLLNDIDDTLADDEEMLFREANDTMVPSARET